MKFTKTLALAFIFSVFIFVFPTLAKADDPTGDVTVTVSSAGGTLSATSCTIYTVGQNSCNTSLSWTTTPATGTTVVYKDGSSTSLTGLTGTNVAYSIPYGTSTFTLNNNGNTISGLSNTVSAACDPATLVYLSGPNICIPISYTLVVTNNLPSSAVIASPGTISCGATCTNSYNVNTNVIIIAPARAGYSVAISNGCTATGGVGVGATCSAFNMTSNKTVDVVYSDTTRPAASAIMTTSWTGDHYVNTNFTAATTGTTDSGSGIRGYRLCRSADNAGGCSYWTAAGEHTGKTEVVSGADLPTTGTFRYYYWYAWDNSGNQSYDPVGEYVRMDTNAPIITDISATNATTGQTVRFYVTAADNATGTQIGLSTTTALFYLGTEPFSGWNRVNGGSMTWDGSRYYYDVTLNDPNGTTYRAYSYVYDLFLQRGARDENPTEFTIVNTPPPISRPISPANGSTVNSGGNVTFTTNSVTDVDGQAVQYYFRVATGSDAETGTVCNSGWQTSTTYSCNPGGGIHYWHVYTYDGMAQTNPDYVWSFYNTRTLTVSKAGNGTGTVTGAGVYNYGTVAGPTAVADVSSTFTGWSGNCSGTSSSTSVTMDANKTCTATFTDNYPTLGAVTITPSAINNDNSSQYTISMSASDTGGYANIYREYAIINLQGANAGAYRGYPTWSVNNDWPAAKNNKACIGGGYAALQSGYGDTYLNLISCNVVDGGNKRTVNFVVTFTSAFYTPTINNDISAYACDDLNQCAGWINNDINFFLIPMSGSIGLSAGSCIISAGANSCPVNITWSTVNPQGISAITASGMTNYDGNSGNNVTFYVPYPSRTFYLYNNNIQLTSPNGVTASCISGTTWDPVSNGGNDTCTLPSGSISASACNIALGASSCLTTLTWSTKNPVGVSSVTTDPSITVATGNADTSLVTGAKTYAMTPPGSTRNFYLYNNGILKSQATAPAPSCIDGSWDGTICSKPLLTVTNNVSAFNVTSSPAGITCGADCTENYNYNTAITITAPAIAGYSVAISNGCTATGGVGVGASCLVTMDAAKTVAVVYSDGTPPAAPGIMTISPVWIRDHYISTGFTAATTGSSDTGSGIRGYRLYRSLDNASDFSSWTTNGEHVGMTEAVSGVDLPSNGTYRWYYWYAFDNSGNQSPDPSGNYVYMDSSAPTYNSTTFTGCTYLNGNNCYVKNGTAFKVNISHTDNGSGTASQYLELTKDDINRGSWVGTTGNIKSYGNPYGISNGSLYSSYTDGMADNTYFDIQNPKCIQTGNCNVTALGEWPVVAGSGADSNYGVTVYMYDGLSQGSGYFATGKWIKLDNTGPSVPTPTDAGAYSSGTSLTFTGAASDSSSGIASCSAQIDVNDTDGTSLAMGSTLVSTNGSYTWSGGVAGNTYYYRYNCTDNVGNFSGWSNWSDGISVNTIPTIITPTVSAITPTTATLGANVTSLGIPSAISARGTCWGTSPAPTTNCLAAAGTTTGVYTHGRTRFTAATTYYYRGYATNTTGTGYSADGTFTTAPASPTGLWAGPDVCNVANINLSWNASSTATATSYQLYRGATLIYNGPLLLATDTGLSLATSYSYTVYATNAGGQSVVSNTVSATVANACATTPNIKVSTTYVSNNDGPTDTTAGNAITLSWAAVTNATSCTLSGGTLGTTAVTVGVGSQATNAGSDGVTQTYTLSCINSTGQSASDSVLVSVPPIPTNVAFACSPDKLTANVSWTAPSGYTAFYLRTSFSGTGVDYLQPGWDNNFVGTAVSIPIAPNTDNSYWMHTRSANGASSSAVSLNLRCNRTQSLTIVSPGAILAPDYTAAGTYTVNYNATPTVTAQGWAGYYASISGGCTAGPGALGANVSCTVPAMTADKTVTVTYAVSSNTLTLNASTGTGTGAYSGTAAGAVNYGTAVSVTATPAVSSNFVSWVATGAAAACNGQTTSPCSFTMNAAASVQATYGLMTGTLTSGVGSCTIALNASSCTTNPTLTWSTTNPIATSAVTAALVGAFPAVNVSGNSGSQSTLFVVPYSSRIFYLYNNSIQLASVTVTSSCAVGSWDGAKCAQNNLTIVSPGAISGTYAAAGTYAVNYNATPTVTAGGWAGYYATIAGGCTAGPGTLGANVSCTLPAMTSAQTVTVTYAVSTVTVSSTVSGGGGTISPTPSVGVNYGSTTAFTVTPNSGYSINSVGGCSGSLVGNTFTTGAITTTCTVTATFKQLTGTLAPTSGTSCTIANNSGVCNLDLNWSITNPIGTPTAITASGTTDITVTNTLTSPQSGTKTVIVPYGGTNFFLYNNSLSLAGPIATTATCSQIPTESYWNGSLCLANPATGNIHAVDCKVASGSSVCNTTLNWDTINPISGFTSTVSLLGSTITTGNSMAVNPGFTKSIYYGNSLFSLAHAGKTLSSVTASATCSQIPTATYWDGSVCHPTTINCLDNQIINTSGACQTCSGDDIANRNTNKCEPATVCSSPKIRVPFDNSCQDKYLCIAPQVYVSYYNTCQNKVVCTVPPIRDVYTNTCILAADCNPPKTVKNNNTCSSSSNFIYTEN